MDVLRQVELMVNKPPFEPMSEEEWSVVVKKLGFSRHEVLMLLELKEEQ